MKDIKTMDTELKVNPISEMQDATYPRHPETHLLAAAIHHSLSAVAKDVTSSTGSSNSDGSIHWPWDPSEGYTPYDSDGTDSPHDMLQKWENYLKLLQSGSDSLYNDALEHLQQLIALGNVYSHLSEDDQKEFNALITSVNKNGESIVNELMRTAMMGAMTKNGTSITGQLATEVFLQQLVAACAPFAGSGDEVIKSLSYQSNTEADVVRAMMKNNIITLTNSAGQSVTVFFLNNGGSNDVPTDFASFVQSQEGRLGNFIQASNISDVMQNYYAKSVSFIFEELRGPDGKLTDPWRALFLMMLVLTGQDVDMGIQVKGYGHQLEAMKDALSKINDLMGKLKSGNLSADDAKEVMGDLTALQLDVNNNPLLAPLAPYLKESINGIMNQNIAPPDPTNPGLYSFTSTGGIFTLPSDLPPCVLKINGQQVLSGHTIYLAPGDKIQVFMSSHPDPSDPTKTIPYQLTLSQLGWTSTLDTGGTNPTPFQTFGDYDAVAKALNGLGLSGITTYLTGMQTTLNGQSATVQQGLTYVSNADTKLQGLIDSGYSLFKDPLTTINRNMQSANQ